MRNSAIITENPVLVKPASAATPILTMLLFGAVFAALVGSGSYVSKQRSLAREIEAKGSAEFVLSSNR